MNQNWVRVDICWACRHSGFIFLGGPTLSPLQDVRFRQGQTQSLGRWPRPGQSEHSIPPTPRPSDCFRDDHMTQYLPTRLSSRLLGSLGKGSSFFSAEIEKIMGRSKSGVAMCPRKPSANEEWNQQTGKQSQGGREVDGFWYCWDPGSSHS